MKTLVIFAIAMLGVAISAQESENREFFESWLQSHSAIDRVVAVAHFTDLYNNTCDEELKQSIVDMYVDLIKANNLNEYAIMISAVKGLWLLRNEITLTQYQINRLRLIESSKYYDRNNDIKKYYNELTKV